MDRQANRIWTNWSGDIRFEPSSAIAPAHEQELQQIVQQAIARGQNIRAIGARHSCSPIFKTNQVVVTSDNFKGLYDHDHQTGLATIGAGMTVEEVGERLFEAGLGMENTGHINKQVMAGAISTGTHGAGKKLSNLSGQVTGLRMVTGTGEIKAFNLTDDPHTMQANHSARSSPLSTAPPSVLCCYGRLYISPGPAHGRKQELLFLLVSAKG
jgi:FAD/FMN-containing dehydrogenase